MTDTTVTLKLEGDISLSNFATAMQRLAGLLESLAADLAPTDEVTYTVANLEAGSALGTFEVRAQTPEAPLRVVRAYHDVGQALSEHGVLPFTPRIRDAATALHRVAELPTIHRMLLQTHLGDAALIAPSKTPAKKLAVAYGTVHGTVQTLTSRRGLRFMLYDTLFDRPVTCYLSDNNHDTMRDMWERQVIVSGQVTRDPDTWQPLAVRAITAIDLVASVDPDSYRRARGVLPWTPGDPPAEQLIRSIRDKE